MSSIIALHRIQYEWNQLIKWSTPTSAAIWALTNDGRRRHCLFLQQQSDTWQLLRSAVSKQVDESNIDANNLHNAADEDPSSTAFQVFLLWSRPEARGRTGWSWWKGSIITVADRGIASNYKVPLEWLALYQLHSALVPGADPGERFNHSRAPWHATAVT